MCLLSLSVGDTISIGQILFNLFYELVFFVCWKSDLFKPYYQSHAYSLQMHLSIKETENDRHLLVLKLSEDDPLFRKKKVWGATSTGSP